jgi:glycosyltransferase involved in cell wall biosynthesis
LGRDLGGAASGRERCAAVKAPAVSVIVPCHDDGRFLDGLVSNLAAQTFRDFEIVIVNDGSTDRDTVRALDALRADLRVVDQDNRYLPGARNRGFAEAQAELVLPLDCDDRLDPSYLAETVALVRQADASVGFVFTDMRLAGALDGIRHCRFDGFDQLFTNRLPYCMLLRKSAWAAVGGYDETMRDGGEDWEFNVRMAQANYRGIGIARPLFIYTVRPEGMLLSKSARLQGAIWRQIRARNADGYRLPALMARWRAGDRGRLSALRASVLLITAKLLPERWFNALYFRLIMLARQWRIARGELRAVQSSG